MTDTSELPGMPDWALRRAASKTSGYKDCSIKSLRTYYRIRERPCAYSALCDMVLKYEDPPVDRKLLCAREAIARLPGMMDIVAQGYRKGEYDVYLSKYVEAITLYEEGFGLESE